jgi:hypothetical protein
MEYFPAAPDPPEEILQPPAHAVGDDGLVGGID